MPHDTPAAAAVDERKLGIDLFNRTWDYIDQAGRTQADTEAMLHAAHASCWHWSQAPEGTPLNMNIGYWQLSRVYALAGMPEPARYWAQRCLTIAQEHDLPPYFLAYGHEALARAAHIAGDVAARDAERAQAEALLDQITEADERGMIEADLAQLR